MKSKLFLMAIVAMLLSTTSCKKGLNDEGVEVDLSVSVGFQIAGIWVDLSIGTGGGYYYPASAYDDYVYGTSSTSNVTVCYVVSKPLNNTAVAVFDGYGNPIGTVSCASSGDWRADNTFFAALRDWDYRQGPCAVLVEWDPIPFTHGGLWSGKIIG